MSKSIDDPQASPEVPTKLRLFFAIPVAIRPPMRRVMDTLSHLGRSVRMVRTDPLHLTLRFLGEVDPARVPDLTAALHEATGNQSAIDARLVGLGVFPSAARATTIWFGLAPVEPIAQVADRLNQVLTSLGFEPENRPFRPHITIARLRQHPPRGLRELLDRHADIDLGACTLTGIELLSSNLTPKGPIYTTLAQVHWH